MRVGSVLMLFVACTFVLAGAGVPRREDIPKYINLLTKGGTGKERANAAEMIGKRGALSVKDVTEAIEPLKTALQKDKDATVRAASARALGAIATEAEKTVPLLVDALKDMSEEVKFASIGALARYGPAAKSANKALNELRAKKDEKKLSMAAGNALKTINAK